MSSLEDPAVVDALLEELSELHVHPEQLTFTTDVPTNRDGTQSAILLPSSKPHGSTNRCILVGVKRLSYLKSQERMVVREIHLLSKARHANIVPFRGFHVDFEESGVWSISDWEPLGNVLEYIRNHDAGVIERLKFLCDIATALAYLHSLGPLIYHGDIKAANVLVSFDRRAMLGGFGQARIIGDERCGKREVDFREFTPWCSPEVVLDGKPPSPQNDIWAFGCLVWEAATGTAPFSDLSTKAEIIRAIEHRWLPQLHHDPFFQQVPGLSRFVMDCWHQDVTVRPSAQENSAIIKTILVDTQANWVTAPEKASWFSHMLARRRVRKCADQRSKVIDKQIKEESTRSGLEWNVLLLGSAESGKSTIIKQIKITHQLGYDRDELTVFRPVVYKNLVDSAKDIVRAVAGLGLDYVEDINRRHATEILAYEVESDPAFRLSAEIASAIGSVWKDPIIATVMDHSSEFYLMDSASYFLGQVQRIGYRDYIPGESDVLQADAKMTGISEAQIGRLVPNQPTMHFFDIDNQRSKRKKWIHCFAGVTSIIFCVALSDYDQASLEAKGQNSMMESLASFDAVVNSRWFLRTPIMLFLNKIDVFKKKLPKVPLERYFPEYTGGPDIDEATKYILSRFEQANRAKLNVYPHVTKVTDTSNARQAFASVKETLLQKMIRETGIL